MYKFQANPTLISWDTTFGHGVQRLGCKDRCFLCEDKICYEPHQRLLLIDNEGKLVTKADTPDVNFDRY